MRKKGFKILSIVDRWLRFSYAQVLQFCPKQNKTSQSKTKCHLSTWWLGTARTIKIQFICHQNITHHNQFHTTLFYCGLFWTGIVLRGLWFMNIFLLLLNWHINILQFRANKTFFFCCGTTNNFTHKIYKFLTIFYRYIHMSATPLGPTFRIKKKRQKMEWKTLFLPKKHSESLKKVDNKRHVRICHNSSSAIYIYTHS